MSTVAAPERITEIDELRIREPLWQVKSRVSWGALMAGTVIAVVTYSLLALLGIAITVSLSDSLTAEQLGTVSGIWNFVTLLLAMFLGGWISTRFTVGEFRNEAVLYGIIVWGISSLVLIPLSTLGIGTSVSAVLASRGITKVNNDNVPMMVSAQEEFSKRFGRLEEKITDTARRTEKTAQKETSSDKSDSDTAASDKKSSSSDKSDSDSTSSDKKNSSKREEETSTSDNSDASSSSDTQKGSRDDSYQSRGKTDDTNSKTARDKLVSASWFAFGGTLLSMLAAVFGAVVGPTISIVHHKIPARVAPIATRLNT